MELPPLMIVTSRDHMHPSFEFCLESALLGGAKLIQLHERGLEPIVFSYLAQLTSQFCHRYKASLIISNYVRTALQLADGAHFPESALESDKEDDLWKMPLKGVSVSSLDAARQADERGADYVIFGPIFDSSSEDSQKKPVGLDALRQVTETVSCPVYATGGINVSNAAQCMEAGAYGVAVRNAVWEAEHITPTVAEFLKVL